MNEEDGDKKKVMKIRVLVLTTTFPRWRDDSTASFVFDLSKQLDKEGVEIIVLAPHHLGAKLMEEMDGIKVYRFPYFWPSRYERLCYGGGIPPNFRRSLLAKIQVPFLFISELFYALKLIKKEGIDLIHAHWIIPSGLVGLICKRIFGIPLIVSSHGSDINRVGNRFIGVVFKHILKNADWVIAVSTALRDKLINLGAQRSKVKVMPCGIELDNFLVDIKKGNDLRILAIGRLIEDKGFHNLIEAMSYVVKEIPDVTLTIVGDGPFREELIRLSKDLSLQDKIAFKGGKPHSEIPRYIQESDLFVLPSMSEGLPLVILEAMACGKAVVATDVGGIPDVIINGETGVLVKKNNPRDLSEAIVCLLSDNKKRMELGEKAREKIQDTLSLENTTKETIKLYESSMKKRD